MSDPKKQVEWTQGREIRIPERIAERVDRRVSRTDFDSVEAYVTFVLEEVLERVEKASAETGDGSDPEDEAEVQNRLEALGYLDE